MKITMEWSKDLNLDDIKVVIAYSKCCLVSSKIQGLKSKLEDINYTCSATDNNYLISFEKDSIHIKFTGKSNQYDLNDYDRQEAIKRRIRMKENEIESLKNQTQKIYQKV